MSLAHPYWLLALILLPLIVVGAAVMSHRQSGKWAQLVAKRLRGALIRRGSPLPRWLSFSFLMAATLLIIAAMTRPQGDGGTRSEKAVGRNLLLALDLSRSMRADDVAPDRLSLAKLVIFELLEAMPNDRIALIGFGGEPYLYAPLTIDHSAVRETVEQMDETWPTIGGSDLGAAVRLGIETLKETGQRNNAMVILTDGEMHGSDLNQMIVEAREAGVYIIAVGVGTEDGAYVPHPDFPDNRMLDNKRNPVLSRLQADSLMKLASETNGSFALAGSGADIPNMVNAAISGLESFEIEGRERKVYIEFYQWLLLPAILLLIASLIAGTRWRGLAPATVMGMMILTLAPTPVQAEQQQASAEQIAMERYAQLAEKTMLDGHRARYRLGEATSAYRLKEWDRASRAYSQALQSTNEEVLAAAHHGLGNTLFQQGWLRFLEEPYSAEINTVPSMKRFEEAVRSKLEELKQGQRVTEVDPDDVLTESAFSYEDIEHTILDWTDAVRHFQSVLDLDGGHQGAIQNRELTVAYLKRLQELLQDDEQKTEQSMPDTQQDPQPGDGDPNQEGDEGDKPDQNGDPNQQGDNPQQSDQGDPKGNKGERDPNGRPNPNQKPPERDPNAESGEDDPKMKPGETPEENARRRLQEGADSEKGPLTPGRILLRKPEKDW